MSYIIKGLTQKKDITIINIYVSNFPVKNTEGWHFLLQEIFPIQGLNPGLLHFRQMLYHLSHQGSHISNYRPSKYNKCSKNGQN